MLIMSATWVYCGPADCKMDDNFEKLLELIKESLGVSCDKANILKPVDAAHKIRYYMNEFETQLCPKIVSELGKKFYRNEKLSDGTSVDIIVDNVAFIMIKVVNEVPKLDRDSLLKAYNIYHIHSLLRIPGFLILFCDNGLSIMTCSLTSDSLASEVVPMETDEVEKE